MRTDFSPRLRGGRIKDGLSCTYEKYIESRDFAEKCRAEIGQVFGECDVLLAASATGEAPVGTDSTGNAAPSAIWPRMSSGSAGSTIAALPGSNAGSTAR